MDKKYSTTQLKIKLDKTGHYSIQSDNANICAGVYGINNKDDNTEMIVSLRFIDEVDNDTLNDKIVKSLKADVESLLNKLKISIDNGNDSNYKMLISNLKGTVELIKELDWTLKYSEYKTEVANDVWQKEVAVWEQNGDCNIRNHKTWKVESGCCDGLTEKEYNIFNPVDNAILSIKYLKEKGLTENELDKITERLFGGLQNKSTVKALLDNINKE